jgi:hypothetical protein
MDKSLFDEEGDLSSLFNAVQLQKPSLHPLSYRDISGGENSGKAVFLQVCWFYVSVPIIQFVHNQLLFVTFHYYVAQSFQK